MAQILVRNIAAPVKAGLQRRARRNRRSMEAEVREILSSVVKQDENTPEVGFGTASVALFSGSGVYLDEPIQELRGFHMEIPKFE